MFCKSLKKNVCAQVCICFRKNEMCFFPHVHVRVHVLVRACVRACTCACFRWCFRVKVTSVVASSGVWRSRSRGVVDFAGLLLFCTFHQKVAIYFGAAAAALMKSLACFHRRRVPGTGAPTKTKPASAAGGSPLPALLHTCRPRQHKRTHIAFSAFDLFTLFRWGFWNFCVDYFSPHMENSCRSPAKAASTVAVARRFSRFVTILLRFFLFFEIWLRVNFNVCILNII